MPSWTLTSAPLAVFAALCWISLSTNPSRSHCTCSSPCRPPLPSPLPSPHMQVPRYLEFKATQDFQEGGDDVFAALRA